MFASKTSSDPAENSPSLAQTKVVVVFPPCPSLTLYSSLTLRPRNMETWSLLHHRTRIPSVVVVLVPVASMPADGIDAINSTEDVLFISNPFSFLSQEDSSSIAPAVKMPKHKNLFFIFFIFK